MDVLTNIIVVIILHYTCIPNHEVVYQIMKLYTLNLPNAVCQLHLNIAGKHHKLGLPFRDSQIHDWNTQSFQSLSLSMISEGLFLVSFSVVLP